MSTNIRIKLVHVVVGLGLLMGFLSLPTPPVTQGECSVQTATCVD
ncbi:MAG: hypothetical protein R3E31_19010 [Chloroflexota bacterium]